MGENRPHSEDEEVCENRYIVCCTQMIAARIGTKQTVQRKRTHLLYN